MLELKFELLNFTANKNIFIGIILNDYTKFYWILLSRIEIDDVEKTQRYNT
mgnify:CR=1 FL=1